MSTLDAGLGALFVLHGEGAFEGDPEVASINENGSQSSEATAAHSPQDDLSQGARASQPEAAELERRLQSLSEEIADLEKEVSVRSQNSGEPTSSRPLQGLPYRGRGTQSWADSFMSQPTIEFTVRNKTKLPIRKLFAQGVVISPGRTLPWVDEVFNYEFPGGLEPSEERHLRLAPNTFGEWGNRDLSDRDDLVLTIVITGLEDAEGRVVEDEGQDRVLELRQRLSTLAAQRETILQSTGGVSGDVLSTGPSGVSTDGVGPPLTNNEKDAFKLAAQRCWNVPAGLARRSRIKGNCRCRTGSGRHARQREHRTRRTEPRARRRYSAALRGNAPRTNPVLAVPSSCPAKSMRSGATSRSWRTRKESSLGRGPLAMPPDDVARLGPAPYRTLIPIDAVRDHHARRRREILSQAGRPRKVCVGDRVSWV